MTGKTAQAGIWGAMVALALVLAGCAPDPGDLQCEPGVAGLSDLATVTPPPC